MAGFYRQSAEEGKDIISQNLWECSESPVLAVMKNPLHAECDKPKLFRIDCREKTKRDSVIREFSISDDDLPKVSSEQKLAFAMYVVRELAPEHRFSHWVERWLSRVDRSRTGARLAMQSLIETAEEVEISLNELTRLGFQKSKAHEFQKSKHDFLWRAWSVAEAAVVFIERPERWEITLAEKVVAAVKGTLNETHLADLADLAMYVAPEKPNANYISPPRVIIRRGEETTLRKQDVASYAVYELRDTDLLIEQHDDISQVKK